MRVWAMPERFDERETYLRILAESGKEARRLFSILLGRQVSDRLEDEIVLTTEAEVRRVAEERRITREKEELDRKKRADFFTRVSR